MLLNISNITAIIFLFFQSIINLRFNLKLDTNNKYNHDLIYKYFMIDLFLSTCYNKCLNKKELKFYFMH